MSSSIARIYFNRYMDRVKLSEITIQEAIALAGTEVPLRWRAEVVQLLRAEQQKTETPEETPEAEN